MTTSIWTDPSSRSRRYRRPTRASAARARSWRRTCLTAVLSAAAYLLREDDERFAVAFTGVFAIAYASWFIGSWAYLAAVTRADQAKFGDSWSLKLTNEGGYIVALLAGLVIANAFPAFAERLRSAVRPELYIKIAIVILGAFIAVTMASKLTLASSLMLRGLAAIVEAYLIYWPIVYLIARKGFGFSREWAAPLASGVSICGVAAAIATGGAIRARPQVADPRVVAGRRFRGDRSADPAVHRANVHVARAAGRRRVDGACGENRRRGGCGGRHHAIAHQAKAAAEGIAYQPGWMMTVTATVKVFIDVFIGVWAFILAYIWTNHINPRAGAQKAQLGEIWERFPKFILGFVATFLITLVARAWGRQRARPASSPRRSAKPTVLRVIFFVLTFFSIGVMSNFRQLWQEGFGKLAAVYLVSLFGFVVWVGFVIRGSSSPASNRRSHPD